MLPCATGRHSQRNGETCPWQKMAAAPSNREKLMPMLTATLLAGAAPRESPVDRRGALGRRESSLGRCQYPCQARGCPLRRRGSAASMERLCPPANP